MYLIVKEWITQLFLIFFLILCSNANLDLIAGKVWRDWVLVNVLIYFRNIFLPSLEQLTRIQWDAYI